MRACAALFVVLYHVGSAGHGIEAHYFPTERPFMGIFEHFGGFGVDLFFAISGFIMIVTTWEAFATRGAGLQFFLRRCVRIYPPFWLASIPLTIVYLVAPSRFTQYHQFHPNLVASYLLLPQLQDPLLGVSWTLVYEIFFYIVFALMLALQRRFIWYALGAWVLAEIACYATLRSSTNAALSFFGHPFPLEFIFGVAAGLAYLHGRLTKSPLLIGLCVLPFAGVLLISLHYPLEALDPLQRTLLNGFASAMLIYGAVSLEAAVGLRAPQFAVELGNASYALYLWHLPVLIALAQAFSRLRVHGGIAHAATLVAMIAFLLGFSYAIYRYIELPMTAYLQRLLFKRGRATGRARSLETNESVRT